MNSAISECAKAAKLLEQARQKQYHPIPAGWFTIEQFMEDQDCAITCARKRLEMVSRGGKLESRKWPKMARDGTTHYQTIYKTK